jgi:hypothetical protein
MKIRKATVDDAASIAILGAHIQQMHHEQRPDWFKSANDKTTIEMYREMLTNAAVTATSRRTAKNHWASSRPLCTKGPTHPWDGHKQFWRSIKLALRLRPGDVVSATHSSPSFANSRMRFRPTASV